MKNIEETLKSNYLYYGSILKLRVDTVQLPNKKEEIREIIEHSGGVCILALTNNNEIVLVEQYRYAFNNVLLELPAGKIDKGETHYEAAKRELEEETGIISTDLKYLGEIYPSVGYTTETIHLYYTTNVKFNPKHASDEIIRITTFPLEKLSEMILENKIVDAKTVCAILKYKFLTGK